MAQRSNRRQLIEGTLRCLERLPPERVTSREIARESGANVASIAYHFGGKDNLVTEAVIEGLDRWLAEVSVGLGDLRTAPPPVRFRAAAGVIETSRKRHAGLAANLVVALAKAPHDARIRETLAAGFHRTRPQVATLLGLGGDPPGHDAGGLVLALFYGLLFQILLDPALAIDGDRMQRAQSRLRTILPDDPAR